MRPFGPGSREDPSQVSVPRDCHQRRITRCARALSSPGLLASAWRAGGSQSNWPPPSWSPPPSSWMGSTPGRSSVLRLEVARAAQRRSRWTPSAKRLHRPSTSALSGCEESVLEGIVRPRFVRSGRIAVRVADCLASPSAVWSDLAPCAAANGLARWSNSRCSTWSST